MVRSRANGGFLRIEGSTVTGAQIALTQCGRCKTSYAMDALLNHPLLMRFFKVLLVVAVLTVIRLVVLTALEKRNPAHFVPYREVVPRDLLASVVIVFGVIPASQLIDRWIGYAPILPQSVLEWPLTVRILLYLVFADFGAYWMHRLVHTRYLWRAHKWHHYPTYMYWQAGVRESVVQTALFNLPYIAAAAFLEFSPWWIFWAILLKNIFANDFMHLNVPWGNRVLDWIIVTPRYHHIHHSDNPEYYNKNLAVLFPVWDHIFGTYLDADKVPRKLNFGIGEKVSAIRLVIGI